METITNNPYVYIAGPFFNVAQIEIVEQIKILLHGQGLQFFSPKDECLYNPETTTPEEVLAQNIEALARTDLAIVITDGKDPGTLFEAGYCYAKGIPIIYHWHDPIPGQNFNLVLAASGSVSLNLQHIANQIVEIKQDGVFIRKNWSEQPMTYE